MTVQQDRRDARVRRIPFEALVEIGGAGTPAFEAESVDISTRGMHLRSAYLPELGETVVCRFDTGQGEPICAEGEVVWRDEAALGGELGIRFTHVDEPSAAALLEMCGVAPAPVEEKAPQSAPPSAKPQAAVGSRVRLHIEGLGAPMRARVRQVGDKQILVGSNLDFLRLGRSLELETVDPSGQRPAEVERVSVEIDPASQVPQLVVELRYTDVAQEEPVAVAAPGEEAPQPEPIEEPQVQQAHVPAAHEAALERVHEAARAEEAAPEEEDDEAYDASTDDEADQVEDAPPPSFERPSAASLEPAEEEVPFRGKSLKEGLGRAAMRVGPALASVGSRAKTTVELLFAKSRGQEEVEGDDVPRRRTTAPPPTGALQAMGRRVVREQVTPEAQVVRKKRTRAMALGAVAGVLSVVGALSFLGSSEKAPDAVAEAAPTSLVQAETGTPSEFPPGFAADTVVATVPLFGPMPLSTITPPPAPAPVAENEGQDEALAASDVVEDEVRPTSAPKPAEKAAAPKKATTVAAFTSGKVTRPITMRLRMDDTITALRGSRSTDGFTVLVPSRRSKDKAGPLAQKDDRILQSKILNGPKGAELTVRFKDKVPAFAVRADGNELVIELESPAKSKPSAVAKKNGTRR